MRVSGIPGYDQGKQMGRRFTPKEKIKKESHYSLSNAEKEDLRNVFRFRTLRNFIPVLVILTVMGCLFWLSYGLENCWNGFLARMLVVMLVGPFLLIGIDNFINRKQG